MALQLSAIDTITRISSTRPMEIYETGSDNGSSFSTTCSINELFYIQFNAVCMWSIIP